MPDGSPQPSQLHWSLLKRQSKIAHILQHSFMNSNCLILYYTCQASYAPASTCRFNPKFSLNTLCHRIYVCVLEFGVPTDQVNLFFAEETLISSSSSTNTTLYFALFLVMLAVYLYSLLTRLEVWSLY